MEKFNKPLVEVINITDDILTASTSSSGTEKVHGPEFEGENE